MIIIVVGHTTFTRCSTSFVKLSQEQTKPDAEREVGYQERDLPRYKAYMAGLDRSFDSSVEQALDFYNLKNYLQVPAAQRDSTFDEALGLADDMSMPESGLLPRGMPQRMTELDTRNELLAAKPSQFGDSKMFL